MGNSRWTRMLMPSRRPSGSDHVNGSRMGCRSLGLAVAPLPVASPTPRFYHSGTAHAITLSAQPTRGKLMPRQIIHRGRKIQVALDTQTLPDGSTVQRDVVIHPGAVA